jgi:hypothetical protein
VLYPQRSSQIGGMEPFFVAVVAVEAKAMEAISLCSASLFITNSSIFMFGLVLRPHVLYTAGVMIRRSF